MDCMFTTYYYDSKKTYWVFAIGGGAILDESPGYDSLEEMLMAFTKILKPDFRGKIPMMADAPEFLKEVTAQVSLEAQYGGTPPTFEYRAINPEDRKRINELLPDGVEIEFQ